MNPDFRDLLAEFNAHGVEFLVVGVQSRRHLIQNKRAAGREQDLVDVKRLERGERDR